MDSRAHQSSSIGAATRDIDDADPRGWRLGGGVSYAVDGRRAHGRPRAALIGVEAEAAEASELDVLRGAGVDIRLVALERGPVFHNLQTDEGRVQMLHQASDPIPAAALPDDWRATPIVMLTPVAAELGQDWAAALPRDAFVALAWQGLLRYLKAGTPVTGLPLTASPLVARADVLCAERRGRHGRQPSAARPASRRAAPSVHSRRVRLCRAEAVTRPDPTATPCRRCHDASRSTRPAPATSSLPRGSSRGRSILTWRCPGTGARSRRHRRWRACRLTISSLVDLPIRR